MATSFAGRTVGSRSRPMTIAAVILFCLASLAALGPASAAPPYAYTGAATVVSQVNGDTVVDNGVVQCTLATNSGAGGFCIPFGDVASHGSALVVTDEVSGTSVSYQVCLDNSGNGVCGDALPDGTCADQTQYSHSSDPVPAYRNPMTVPTAPAAGCPGSRGFDGLVVFVCTGVDNDHTEIGTSGTATLQASGGSAGFTEPGPPVPFCGGDSFSFKSYLHRTHSSHPWASSKAPPWCARAGRRPLDQRTTHVGTEQQHDRDHLGPAEVVGLIGSVAGVGPTCKLSRGYAGNGT